MTKLPQPGDRVRVQWGFRPTEGEVVYADDHGEGGPVMVEVSLDDVNLRSPYPVEQVEPAVPA